MYLASLARISTRQTQIGQYRGCEMKKIRYVTNEHRSIMKRDYLNGHSGGEIGKKLKFCATTIMRHLKSMNVDIRSDHAKQIDFSKKEHLAYIEGVLCGDGWAYNNKKTFRYFIGIDATDKEFVTKFKKSLEDVGLNIWFGKSKDNCWRALGNSKLLYLWHNEKPHRGFNTDKEKRAFLEGFYESDGTSNPKNLQYCNTKKDLLLLTKEYLDHFNIENTLQGPYKNNRGTKYYFLRIRSRSKDDFMGLIHPINKFNKVKING